MGSNKSKVSNSQKTVFKDDLLTFFVLNCENSSAFPHEDTNEKILTRYDDHKLIVSIEYNGQKERNVSCDYYKNSVWNKGVIQYPYDASVEYCVIKLYSDSEKSPKYESVTFNFNERQQGEIIPVQFRIVGTSPDDSGANIDGASMAADASNNTVNLNIFFTTALETLKNGDKNIIQSTRGIKDHFSIVTVKEQDLDNGDIILYSGSSPISELIRDRFYRPWSHVGIVIKTIPFVDHTLNGQPIPQVPQLYVMEACGKEGIQDPFRDKRNQAISGVNIFKLKDRIIEYGGYSVQAIRLHTPLTPELKEKFLANCFELHGERLSFDVFQASVLLLERLKQWNKSGDKSVFCSELVTICLDRVGKLVQTEKDAANNDPGEVADFGCFSGSEILHLKYDL